MRRLALGAGLLLVVALAGADEQPHYNLVRLQVQQSEQVGNDTMHVTLHASGEGRDAEELAAQINRDMAWALEQTAQVAAVKAGTGNYRTWQVRQDNKMKGWRAQQELLLESRDSVALSRLAGRLQEKLQVVAMDFSVSPETRNAVENRLIEQALQSFGKRARLISDRLQAQGYRIVELDVGTFSQPPPVVYRAPMAMVAAESDAAVAARGGESDVQVTVSGSIELNLP